MLLTATAAWCCRAQFSCVFGPGTSPFLADELPQLLQGRALAAGTSVLFNITVSSSSAAAAADDDPFAADDSFRIDVHLGSGGGSSSSSSSSSSSAVRLDVTSGTALGASHGALAALQSDALGFAFLHPMRVFSPPPPQRPVTAAALVRALNGTRRAPRYGTWRGSHVHCEHPAELCNLLNGFDAAGGHADAAAWAALLPEWRAYLRWLVAHGQNAVEWSLLSAKAYGAYSESAERRRRLRVLAAEARRYGLRVGVDATFAQTQEHGFRLWRTAHAAEEDDWAEIKARLDWLVAPLPAAGQQGAGADGVDGLDGADGVDGVDDAPAALAAATTGFGDVNDGGFDYVQSELGQSELQEGAPNTTRLVALLNRTAAYLAAGPGGGAPRAFMVENHISGGQTVDLPDPLHPGRRLNFNWLTYYLDARIVSRPHTVQVRPLLATD